MLGVMSASSQATSSSHSARGVNDQETKVARMERLHRYHGAEFGHGGVSATLFKLKRDGIQWLGMRKDVEEFVSACPFCQKLYDGPRQSHGTTFSLSANSIGQCVYVDTCSFNEAEDTDGYKHLVVFIDGFSRYVELYPVRTLTAEEATETFRQYCLRYGIPRVFKTDPGSQFKNSRVTEMLLAMRASMEHTTAGNKEENGMVERVIRSVRRHLATLLLEDSTCQLWSSKVLQVAAIINRSPHSALGCAPVDLQFGVRYHLQNGEEEGEGTQVQVDELVCQAFRASWASVTDVQRRLERADSAKPISELTVFDVGSLVTVDATTRHKSNPRDTVRKGPLMVVKQEGNVVIIRDLVDANRERRIHVSRCRKFLLREDVDAAVIAAQDREMFVVEQIMSHRLTQGKRPTLHNTVLVVKWRYFEDTSEEPLSNLSIRQCQAFQEYAREVPGLREIARKAVPTVEGG